MNEEIRYGYVIDFHEYSKDRIKDAIPLASELEDVYSSKEECLEKAKEKILLYNNFDLAYIYVCQILKGNISLDSCIMDNIIEMIQDNNEERVFNYGEMHAHKKEIKEIIESYFNNKNNWAFIEIMEDDVEVYKIKLKKTVEIETMDKMV